MVNLAKRLVRYVNETTDGRLVLPILNQYLEGVLVLKLNIDSHAKTIHAELLPQGQRQVLIVDVEGYKLDDDGERTILSWSAIRIHAGSIDLHAGLKSKLEWLL